MRSTKLSTNQEKVQPELFCVSYVSKTPTLVKTPDNKSASSKAKRWLAQNINYIPVVIAFLISTSAMAQKTPPDPGVGGTVAGFEVDADFVSGYIPPFWNTSPTAYYPNTTTYGDDWSQGSSFSAVLKQIPWVGHPGQTISDTGLSSDAHALWQIDGNWGNRSAVAEKYSFQGNSNKNGDDIRLSSHPYSLQVGGAGPQKNDITQTFLHSRTDNNGDLWFFFAAETRSTDGTSYIDCEYNQAGVTIANNKLYGPANSGDIINGRTVNDFIIVVNYTGGGNKPTVGIRVWLSTGQWSNEMTLPTGDAFIATNTQNVNPVAPNRAFATDGSYANVTGALQLVEGGVNLSALDLAFNTCTPEATVTIKTRSSASFTAELKDLDRMEFSITPPASVNFTGNLSECQDISGTNSFHVKGKFSGGTPNFTATGGTKSNQVIAGDSIEADIAVTGVGTDICTVVLTIANSACGDAKDSITLSISAKPNKPKLTVIDPSCSRRYGTITVDSPANSPGNVLYEYSYNDGTWDTAHIFQFQGGDGYKVEVRAIASPDCSSDAEECTGDLINGGSSGPEKIRKDKFNNQLNINEDNSLGELDTKDEIKTDQMDLDTKNQSLSDLNELNIHPNPFNSLTTIEFKTENAGYVTLKVYDVNGKLVSTLYNNNAAAGTLNQVTLDGTKLPDGIYFTHLLIDNKLVKTSKIVLQK